VQRSGIGCSFCFWYLVAVFVFFSSHFKNGYHKKRQQCFQNVFVFWALRSALYSSLNNCVVQELLRCQIYEITHHPDFYRFYKKFLHRPLWAIQIFTARFAFLNPTTATLQTKQRYCYLVFPDWRFKPIQNKLTK